jgi:hypothetical protein
MKTEQFIDTLEQHSDATLHFSFEGGKQVRADYHITEFKNVATNSVDCGGKVNSWKSLVIQLWEPPITGSEAQMTAGKALSIMRKVEESLALTRGVELTFEYSSADYQMAEHHVKNVKREGNRLVFDLSVGETECKGLSSGACGITDKAKVAMTSLGGDECCTPGGGCC